MSYDTTPVSIRKKRQLLTTNQRELLDGTSGKLKDPPEAQGETPLEAPEPKENGETPSRKSFQLSESPQFLHFAESPEFRVGWDDGFEPKNKICDQLKLNENSNSGGKKSRANSLQERRNFRTQRLKHTQQPEKATIENSDSHPDCDEFLQWAQSLLCANVEPDQDPCIPSDVGPKPVPTCSKVHKTPDKLAEPYTPSSCEKKQNLFSQKFNESFNCDDTDILQSLKKKKSLTPSRKNSGGKHGVNSMKRNSVETPPASSKKILFQQENKIEKSNKINASTHSANVQSSNVEVENEFNDFFNDSVNELMIKCSQAVETTLGGKTNKKLVNTEPQRNENSNLSNMLDDSANDMILECTQQVESKLLESKKTDSRILNSKSDNNFSSVFTTVVSPVTKINKNNNKVQISDSIKNNNMFCPSKINANNTTNDMINTFNQRREISDVKTNVIASNRNNNNKFASDQNFASPIQNTARSASSRADHLKSNEKTASNSPSSNDRVKSNKHFLSPNNKDAPSRKKRCSGQEFKIPAVQKLNAPLVSNEDLNSFLDEDEDVLSSFDIDQVVMSQTQMVPFVPKTTSIIASSQNNKPHPSSSHNFDQTSVQSKVGTNGLNSNPTDKNQITFNGLNPDPGPTNALKTNPAFCIKTTIPISQTSADIVPKYTQHQIEMKKIEAKRRQAMKIRLQQKTF